MNHWTAKINKKNNSKNHNHTKILELASQNPDLNLIEML